MSFSCLLTNIQWDTNGESVEECNLPEYVLVIDVLTPLDDEFVEETIGDSLSEAFGFTHDGFSWEQLTPAQYTHAGGGFFPDRLGVIRCPERI